MLEIRDLTGESFILPNVQRVTRKRKVNGDRMLSFAALPTQASAKAWDAVSGESTAVFLNDRYTLKDVGEKDVGKITVKVADGVQEFFNAMIGVRQDAVYSQKMTLAQVMAMVFENTNYTFTVVSAFGERTVEDFGDDNCLELFSTALEIFNAEFKLSGNTVMLYDQIGADTGFQFRWKHNIQSIERSSKSQISTYIKGFGKLKEIQDTLSGSAFPYTSRFGTFYTEPGQNLPATSTINAGFRFNFTGTGFQFNTVMTFLGGVWEFSIDGVKTVKVSTYKDVTAENQTLEVVRGLEHGAHTVVATFKGKDSKNPYTQGKTSPDPIAYLKTGNILTTYRELVGDERYEAVAEYTSPNASKFVNPGAKDGLYRAPNVDVKDANTNAEVLAIIKRVIQDEPTVSIKVDVADLGLDNGVLNEGDRGYIIYEPMGITIGVRIIELEEIFEFVDGEWRIKRTVATLGNSKRRITDKTTRFSQTSKIVNRLVEGKKALPYNAMADALVKAAEDLKSAQTELEFMNGIIAREKTDANKLVLFNSAGIGISDDAGQTFKTAMTADGIVADVVNTGSLRTNNVTIVGEDDLFYWDGNGLIAVDPADAGKYVKLDSSGMYIANGALSIERPDGYVVMDNGLLRNDFSLQPTNPEFRDKERVGEQGVYWTTTETSPQNCAAYFFAHKSRYLKVMCVLHDLNSGLGSRMSVWEVGGDILGQTTRYFETDATATPFPIIMTIDLGVPDGSRKGIYIRLNTNAGGEARGRVMAAWLEG